MNDMYRLIDSCSTPPPFLFSFSPLKSNANLGQSLAHRLWAGGLGPSGGGPHKLGLWLPLFCVVLNNDNLRARRPWGEDRTAFLMTGIYLGASVILQEIGHFNTVCHMRAKYWC